MADDRAEFDPVPLEVACEWTARDVSDPAQWTERLSDAEI